jgi:DNA-binding XRE family transcriptional regulator
MMIRLCFYCLIHCKQPALLQHAGQSCRATGPISYSNIFALHQAGRYTPSPGGYNSRTGIPALPFSRMVKTAQKPKPLGYPIKIDTIGDHLRSVRMDKKLFQEDLAKQFKVSLDTITNWENNKYEPHISYYKEIISFLEYYPFTHDTATIGGRILKYRRLHGLTHRQMGRKVGVNATTIAAWESGENKPQENSLFKLQKLLDKM